jgi:sodium-dependent dicarboxylate transporter 2/3/5
MSHVPGHDTDQPAAAPSFIAGGLPRLVTSRLWKPLLTIAVLAAVAGACWYSQDLPLKGSSDALSASGLRVIAIFTGALVLWLTEAVPLIATGVGIFTALVLAQIPVAWNGTAVKSVAAAAEVSSWFGDRVVFFLLGIFLLAGSLTASHVVDHGALRLLNLVGTSPRRLRQGVYWVAFVASWFMAEHAVAAMLFPVVARIRDALGKPRQSSTYVSSLFLALAWGATIGGIVTYLGGARIALAMGIVQKAGLTAPGFFELMAHSLPIAIPFGILAALILEWAFPIDLTSVEPARAALQERRRELGRFGPRQQAVLAILALTIGCWALFGVKHLAPVALGGAALLLGTRLVRWHDVQRYVPWDLLILEAGALALCSALQATGSAEWAAQLFFNNISHNPFLVVGLLTACVVVLTELFSNPAVVTLLVPLLLQMAPGLGMDPIHLALAVALPCGLSFVLPLGSPPLAIAFASGEYKVATVMKWGVLLDLLVVPFTVLAFWAVWLHLH